MPRLIFSSSRAATLFVVLAVASIALGKEPKLDKVVIVQSFGMGYGGMMTFEFQPYLLFADGTVMRHPSAAPADLDIQKSRTAEPRNWGRYQINGKELLVTWPGKQPRKEDRWWPARPANQRDTLGGTYSAFSGVGSTGPNSSAVASTHTFHFNPDGTFTRAASVGSTSGRVSAHAAKEERGTYKLEGHAISLTTSSGQTDRLLFFFYPDSRDTIGIGGRVLSKEKASKISR